MIKISIGYRYSPDIAYRGWKRRAKRVVQVFGFSKTSSRNGGLFFAASRRKMIQATSFLQEKVVNFQPSPRRNLRGWILPRMLLLNLK